MNELVVQHFPFRFFCEEQYTTEILSGMMNDLYEEVMTETNFVPSLELFIPTSYLGVGMIARAIYKNELPSNVHIGFTFLDHFVGLEEVRFNYEQSGKTAEDFLESVTPHIETSSLPLDTQEMMKEDIRHLLLQNNLFFFDIPYSYDAIREFEKYANKPRSTLLYYHAPIKKVW